MTVLKLITQPEMSKESAVAHLECALEMAKAGEIECVAIAAVRPSGMALWLLSDSGKPVTLLGAVHGLAHMLAKEVVE